MHLNRRIMRRGGRITLDRAPHRVVIVGAGPTGVEMAGQIVIWAAGVTPSSLARTLARAGAGEFDQAGRLIVEPDLTVLRHPEILAVGEMITIRPDGEHKPLPGWRRSRCV